MSSFQLTPVAAPSSLKDQAYRAIKEAILNLHMRPGQALVESELAEQLGISKTPVRDALLDLEREGLVTKILFRGTYVSDIDPEDVREIFQVRAVLEGLAARLAAPSIGDRDLERADALLTAGEAAIAAGDSRGASDLNRQFHSLIIDCADNRRLQIILRNLDDQLQRFRLLSDQLAGRQRKSAVEHRQVLAALQARDAALAEVRMCGHMHSVLADLSKENPQPARAPQSERVQVRTRT